MISYIVRRLMLMPITLIGITLMVFLIARFAPGRPGQMQAGNEATDAATQKALQEWYDERFGLNDPLPKQYWNWWKGLFTKQVQATAWFDADPSQPLQKIYTLRRPPTEYYLRLDDGRWFQAEHLVFDDSYLTADSAEFLGRVRKPDIEHQPPIDPNYASPTHLFATADLHEIESLEVDLQAERLTRAEDLRRVKIALDIPAWTENGEPLYENPQNPDQPIFERDGQWFSLKLNGSLETAEVKPVGDAAVRSRMGAAFSDLPQEQDGYVVPRHAFLFGLPQPLTQPVDTDFLQRLTIQREVESPSGIWVQIPGTEQWGMLWEQDDPVDVLLLKREDGTFERLVPGTRATPLDPNIYVQSNATFTSRLLVADLEGLNSRSQEKRDPRHAVFHGEVRPYTGKALSERDVRTFQHATRVFEVTMGESKQTGRTVMEELKDRLPKTLLINLVAFPLIYALAIPVGMLMAVKRGRTFDGVANVVLLGLWSIPTVLSATLLIGYFTVGGEWLQLFPNTGLSSPGSNSWLFLGGWDESGKWEMGYLTDLFWHLVLPVVCIVYGGLAYLAKQMRAAMLDNFTMDYVRTAKAKGVRSKDVVFRHVLRNSLLPLITIFATILPALIAGSVIIEVIFGIEGMGQYAFRSVQSRDYDPVQSLALIAGALNLTGILLADICYAVADPRISYS